MSLRLRLFLLIGGLAALLVLAQWWWARLLTRDLSSELDVVVQSVGKSMVAFLQYSDLEGDAPPHEAVFQCRGEGCESVEVGHHIERLEEGSQQVLATTEGDVHIEHIVKASADLEEGEEPGGDPAEHHSYTYHFENHLVTPNEPRSSTRELARETVKLKIERKGDARYLWVGAPHANHRVQIPHQGFSERLDIFSQRMVFGSLGLLTLGLLLAGILAHRITAPLRQLANASRLLGQGALGTQVPVRVDGEVGEAIGAFNRMSSQLEELDARARALDAHKHLGEIGEIARGLAHTLRNPLNALGLSVEELAAQTGSEEADPSLAESARRQIRRIDQSIRSFLALASQSGGVLSEIDIGELIDDVGLEALQDGRGKVRLAIDVEEEMPRLHGVEPELRAVLQALMVNAVEASPKGGQVRVRAVSPAAGRVRVEIEDEGPGLAPEVRERLFTPHLSTKANGSGMGLFLAHRIATNRYDGQLELADRSDAEGRASGTRACLELGQREPSLSGGDDE